MLMKVILLGMVLSSFVFLMILSQYASAQEPECEKLLTESYNGNYSAGKTIATLLNNSVSQFSSNLNLHNHRTFFVHSDGVTLITKQTLTKTLYNYGDPIELSPTLINVGNKSVIIGQYTWEPFFVVIDYKNGSNAFHTGPLKEPGFMEISPFVGINLEPNKPSGVEATLHRMGPPPDPSYINPKLYKFGNFMVYTVSDLFLDENGTCNRVFLWSNPLQITVLPEKIPEFPSLLPIFVISVSIIILISSRVKIKF